MKRSFLQAFVAIIFISCTQTSGIDKEINKITASIQQPVFREADYIVDAVADGVTDVREAIQKAINQCSYDGGGRVIIKPGKYFCKGPIQLKSDVNLHLEEGSEILFSPDPTDYTPMELTVWEGTELINYRSPINAYMCENIAITGKGILNGQGNLSPFTTARHVVDRSQPNALRRASFEGVPPHLRGFGEESVLPPAMLQPWGCNKVLLEDFTLLDSPFWCIHPFYCYNVTVRRVNINSQHLNNDGIDPDCTSYVLIEDCYFDCLDDAVAVKAGRDKEGWRSGKKSHDIVVRNCLFNTGSAGLVVGSEMSAGVYRVFAKNIHTTGGKTLFSIRGNQDRGGFVRDIHVENMTADSVSSCVFLFNHRYTGLVGGNIVPKVSNVTMRNCKALKSEDCGIVFHGLEQCPPTEFLFENIEIDQCNTPLDIDNFGKITFRNVRINGEVIAETQHPSTGPKMKKEIARKHTDFERNKLSK